MKISPISNVSQPRIYNMQKPYFKAKPTPRFALPEFENVSFFDRLKFIFTDIRSDIANEMQKQDKIMKSLRIDSAYRANIFESLAIFKDVSSYRNALSSLTEGNISRHNPQDFIYNRICSSENNNKFVRKQFELFNQLYDNCTQDGQFDVCYIKSIVKNISIENNIGKGKADFALKWIGQKGCYDVANSVSYYPDADELYEAGLLDFSDFLRRINNGYSPAKVQIDVFKYLFKKISTEINIGELCQITNKCIKQGVISNKILDFVGDNIDDKNINLYVSLCCTEDNKDIDNVKLARAKRLVETGMTDYTSVYTVFKAMRAYNDYEEPWNVLIELNTRINCNAGFKAAIIQSITDSEGNVNRESLEKLLAIYNIALKNKETLREGNDEITNEDIDRLIFDNPAKTLNTLEILGEKTFVYSFKNKIDEVEYYINELFGDIIAEELQPLLEVINPMKSYKYEELDKKIKELKTELRALSGGQKEDCINKINTLTKQRNELIKNSIKDPKDALDLAIIYAVLYKSVEEEELEKVIPNINPKSEDEKQHLRSILNGLLLKSMRIEREFDSNVLSKIDFSKNKYLSELFNSDDEFAESFEKLLGILQKESAKSNSNIFNSLPQNRETRKMFQELGVDYRKWVKVNPGSHIKISIDTDVEKAKQAVIKNLEDDFTGDLFTALPAEEKETLLNRLKENGFTLSSIETPVFDRLGYLKEKINVLRFCKDGELIDIKDLKQIISIVREEMNQNEFWTKSLNDKKLHSIKETFKDHILKLRYNEVKNLLKENSTDKRIELVIQKADMNDIQHALFLGNHAGCCTAVNSYNGYSAVTYIMNKLVTAIEIKDNEKFVGNTMCYLANVDSELALVLDNIEMKSKYQYNDNIRDAIFAYAEKLCTEIGKPDLPIYLGPNRHKVNLAGFEVKKRQCQIVGSTGSDKIYLDFDAFGHKITGKDVFEMQMYKMR